MGPERAANDGGAGSGQRPPAAPPRAPVPAPRPSAPPPAAAAGPPERGRTPPAASGGWQSEVYFIPSLVSFSGFGSTDAVFNPLRNLLLRNSSAVPCTALLSLPQTSAFRLAAPAEAAPGSGTATLTRPPLPPGYLLLLPPRSMTRLRIEFAVPPGGEAAGAAPASNYQDRLVLLLAPAGEADDGPATAILRASLQATRGEAVGAGMQLPPAVAGLSFWPSDEELDRAELEFLEGAEVAATSPMPSPPRAGAGARAGPREDALRGAPAASSHSAGDEDAASYMADIAAMEARAAAAAAEAARKAEVAGYMSAVAAAESRAGFTPAPPAAAGGVAGENDRRGANAAAGPGPRRVGGGGPATFKPMGSSAAQNVVMLESMPGLAPIFLLDGVEYDARGRPVRRQQRAADMARTASLGGSTMGAPLGAGSGLMLPPGAGFAPAGGAGSLASTGRSAAALPAGSASAGLGATASTAAPARRVGVWNATTRRAEAVEGFEPAPLPTYGTPAEPGAGPAAGAGADPVRAAALAAAAAVLGLTDLPPPPGRAGSLALDRMNTGGDGSAALNSARSMTSVEAYGTDALLLRGGGDASLGSTGASFAPGMTSGPFGDDARLNAEFARRLAQMGDETGGTARRASKPGPAPAAAKKGVAVAPAASAAGRRVGPAGAPAFGAGSTRGAALGAAATAGPLRKKPAAQLKSNWDDLG